MRILIVEDNALLALMLEDELVKAGHDVIGPAYASSSARELTAKQPCDLALVDIDLQDGPTGGPLAKELRIACNCTVIFATGQIDLVSEWTEYALGALPKPYDPQTILQIVDAVGTVNEGGSPNWPYQFQLFASVEAE